MRRAVGALVAVVLTATSAAVLTSTPPATAAAAGPCAAWMDTSQDRLTRAPTRW